MDSDGIELLRLQIQKYQALADAAPKNSGAHRAATVCVEQTKKALDVLVSLATPPGDG